MSDKYLNDKGIVKKEYNLTEISYDYLRNIWWIIYDDKDGPLGGHFTLKINDRNTVEIKLIGGA